MNSKETLNFIENNFSKIPSMFLKDDKLKEAKETIETLLKKDIPVAPKYYEESNQQYFNCGYICPTCGETMSDEVYDVFTKELIAPKFCPSCGQRFDWESTEKK
jgi:rubrerythrin